LKEKQKLKKLKNLIDKIFEASKIIHDKALRGDGNYVIVSSKVAEMVDNLDIKKLRKKKLKKIFEEQKKQIE